MKYYFAHEVSITNEFPYVIVKYNPRSEMVFCTGYHKEPDESLLIPEKPHEVRLLLTEPTSEDKLKRKLRQIIKSKGISTERY